MESGTPNHSSSHLNGARHAGQISVVDLEIDFQLFHYTNENLWILHGNSTIY